MTRSVGSARRTFLGAPEPGWTTQADVVIVGSGIAGLTAALYAARANLAPLVFAGNAPLGQLMITSDVENYPGFPDGILGPELMDLFRRQAERFGAHLVEEDVTKVDFSERPFKLWVRDQEYLADAVIVGAALVASLRDGGPRAVQQLTEELAAGVRR